MYKTSLYALLLSSFGLSSFALADDQLSANSDSVPANSTALVDSSTPDAHRLASLKNVHLHQFKVDAKVSQPEVVKDPLQPLNRKIYIFNTYLDDYIARPIAEQYVKVVPEDIRGGYGNFRSNMREPWSALNQGLQGKPKTSIKSLARFTLNSLTSLGFADVARRKNLDKEATDFGTTLGVWGLPSGPFVMLPFFGPSTFRDGIGLVADAYGKPQQYIIDEDKLYWTVQALDLVDSRAKLLDVDSLIQGDQYAVLRDAYLQQRSYAIKVARGDDLSTDLFSDDN
jgi:phospholipid-binding lipoprotein MlaA